MRAVCERLGPVLLTVLLLSVLAAADEEGPDLEAREREARRLIDLSGVYRSMDFWPGMAVSAAGPYRGQASPEVFEVLEITLRQGYDSAVAREIEVQQLSTNFDPDAPGPIEWWFNSDLGRRVESLELRANSPEGSQQMQSYSQFLASNPAPDEQVEAAERYDRATGRSESLSRTLYAMTESIFLALNEVAPQDRQLSAEQVEEQLAKLKIQLPMVFRGFILAQLLYIQKDLSREERSELVAFSESDSAQWLSRNHIKGLDRALENGSRRFREAFTARLAKQSN